MSDPRLISQKYFLIAGCAILGAILFLTATVVRDLRELNSASSDNVQWTISQTEVEFLEFSKQLNLVAANPELGLTQMRRRFDVFYSRVETLHAASIYIALGQSPTYAEALANVRAFLDESVPLIDSDDAVLHAGLRELATRAAETRPEVRKIANAALDYFAIDADERRAVFTNSLLQLAFLVLVLIFGLAVAIYYLNRLNLQNSKRQQEIEQSAERMNTVIETSLDGVIVGDRDGNILAFNAAAEGIFGYRSENVLGEPLAPLILPDIDGDASEALSQHVDIELLLSEHGRVQMDAKRANGEIFPIELSMQSAKTDAGPIFIAFLRDISASVRAEKELIAARDQALAADRLKTDFLATMSHEIRTPLNGLLGNLSLIQDTKLNHQQVRYIRNMETSGRLLLGHVTDVLDISRYDVGQLELREVPVNIDALLQTIIDSQSGTATSHGTQLGWRWIGGAQNWVISDPDRLQHILMNLVGNAVKFTEGGRVDVSAEVVARHDHVVDIAFCVRDTGRGIADDLKDRIFEDFVTGSTAYDRNVGGTGLGLSIARRFALAMGGDISVESTLGEGSTFRVLLPFSPTVAPNLPKPQEATRKAPAIGLRILIVEDNEINRAVVRGMLHADGHTTTEVHDGAAAVEITNDNHFDLILMDISMPIMDGRAATRAIRSGDGRCAKTPIVALTANVMAAEQEAFLQDGMNDILIKPLSRDALADVLHRFAPDGQSAQDTDIAQSNQSDMRDILGDEEYQGLRTQFVHEAEALHDWLGDTDDHHFGEIASRCHKVAGSAAVFGATAYRAALIEIEHAAKGEVRDAIAVGQRKLAPIWGSTKDRI
ncbi:hypothetical protein TW80_06705 [Loktanella sp. S4079]|nr:hypothetical protein TW80_06705 [Loktanella sp. S4079]